VKTWVNETKDRKTVEKKNPLGFVKETNRGSIQTCGKTSPRGGQFGRRQLVPENRMEGKRGHSMGKKGDEVWRGRMRASERELKPGEKRGGKLFYIVS